MNNFVGDLKRIFERSWKLAKSVPVTEKLIGLALFPLILASISIIILDTLYLQATLGRSAESLIPASTLTITTRVFVIVGGSAALGLGVSLILTLLITRQLRNLVEIMKRVELGDLEARAPIWADDEIGRVQVAFNFMVG